MFIVVLVFVGGGGGVPLDFRCLSFVGRSCSAGLGLWVVVWF